MTTTADRDLGESSADPGLRKVLGFVHLTAIALGGAIGSGWLLTPMYAAQDAGPASVITWVVAGLALVPMALVLVELGASYPRSGGLVRWPLLSSGRLVGTLAGWCIWIAYTTNPPSEAAAALQYLGPHGTYSGKHLTLKGTLLDMALMVLFVSLNWFGVHLFARFNFLLTAGKVAVPVITALALLASHFDRHNLTGHGALAPYGAHGVLSAITTSGVFFAYTGFQSPLDFTGETKGDRRNIPRAVVTGLLVSMVLYVGLQLAFLGSVTVPGGDWTAINLHSPFVHLAVMFNIGWLGILLRVDAVASPAGSAVVYTAEGSRVAYAMGHPNYRLLPGRLGSVHDGTAQPRTALLVNLAVGACVLFLLKNWQSIITVASALTLFGYAMSLVAERAIRDSGRRMANLVSGTRLLGPVSFTVTTLIFYWTGWHYLRWVFLTMALAGLVAVAGHRLWDRMSERFDRADLVHGLWVVGYLLALAVLSKLGASSGALKLVPSPADSVLVAVVAVLGYAGALDGARRHLRRHARQPELDDAGMQ